MEKLWRKWFRRHENDETVRNPVVVVDEQFVPDPASECIPSEARPVSPYMRRDSMRMARHPRYDTNEPNCGAQKEVPHSTNLQNDQEIVMMRTTKSELQVAANSVEVAKDIRGATAPLVRRKSVDDEAPDSLSASDTDWTKRFLQTYAPLIEETVNIDNKGSSVADNVFSALVKLRGISLADGEAKEQVPTSNRSRNLSDIPLRIVESDDSDYDNSASAEPSATICTRTAPKAQEDVLRCPGPRKKLHSPKIRLKHRVRHNDNNQDIFIRFRQLQLDQNGRIGQRPQGNDVHILVVVRPAYSVRQFIGYIRTSTAAKEHEGDGGERLQVWTEYLRGNPAPTESLQMTIGLWFANSEPCYYSNF